MAARAPREGAAPARPAENKPVPRNCRGTKGRARGGGGGWGLLCPGPLAPPLPPAGRPVTAGQRRPRTAGREAKLAAARRCKALGARPPAAVPGCKPPTSAGSARCQSAFANTGVGWVRSSAARVAFCPAPLSRATPTPPRPIVGWQRDRPFPPLRAPPSSARRRAAPWRPPRVTLPAPGEGGAAVPPSCCAAPSPAPLFPAVRSELQGPGKG